ncbi:unnamed protein product [Oncorhynchus mykiss]|uniref:Uncharacterized protein n=1 Tax=Oncorhynchus mykiss TaxID=8022 RepID=A0A060YL55_ONCMY|nr:unnamed protein product [Oncorhynchus mykiss]
MLFNLSPPAPARLTSITTLDGSDLEYVDIYKYLGVWLDCKLSFQTHIKHLQSKIKSRVGFLFRNKATTKLTLVKLTILAILDFGDVIYKSMPGKAPPYLSSLVTMATPTRSKRSSRCISLIIPKANTSFGRLSFQFSAACDWNELQKSLKLETFISLTNFKHLVSEQLTDRCSCT